MAITYLPRFEIWPLWKRNLVILGTIAAFLIVFSILYPIIGGIAIILSFVPVAAVSWMMGQQAGMFSGMLAVLLNVLLLSIAGEPGWNAVFIRGGLSSLTLILLGGLAGWVSQLIEKLSSYASQLEQDREELRTEVAIREQTERKLEAALAEKEVLIKEIHHRVKNNLQIISSLLNLQSNAASDPQILAQFQDSRSRVRSMAFIHERLYRSRDLAHVNFGEYLRDLAHDLLQSYRAQNQSVVLKVHVDDIHLDIDTAIPCGLIITELVSNALKHAFPDGRNGEVNVEMRCSSTSQYQLAVWDDGVGIPAEMDYRKMNSLGLQLVNNLTRQLGGAVKVQSPGTRFTICFPSAATHELCRVEDSQ